MLGSRVLMLLLPLMLPPLTWLAETRAVPEGSRPAWVRGQQLSQQLCTLAWGTHPPMGHVVSHGLWCQTGDSPSSPRLRWKTLWLWMKAGGSRVITE